MPQIDLSIIIVSWNVKDLLEKCLESICHPEKRNDEGLPVVTKTNKILNQVQDDIKIEIFVVDNDSRDGSVEMIKEKFPASPAGGPKVRLIANQKNIGFAKANNQAIKQAKGDYVLLLNPDTEILNSALEKSLKFIKDNPQIGVLGCQILNPDGSLQSSIRRFPMFSDQAGILLKIHHLWPNLAVFKRYLAQDADYSQPQSVEQVMGAFFLIRREVIDKIGFLDKNFFIWFEEVDFCQRVKQAGWQVYYYPKAQIIHHFAQSFSQRLPLEKQKIFNRSLRYYFKKHHSFLAYLGICLVQPISLFLAWIIDKIQSGKISTPL